MPVKNKENNTENNTGKNKEKNDESVEVGVPTWKFIWGLISFRSRYYTLNNLSFVLMMLGWLVPGLVTKAFFDLLTGDAPAHFNIVSLLAILVASGLVRVFGVFGLVRTNTPF